jgi:hypothetical protein
MRYLVASLVCLAATAAWADEAIFPPGAELRVEVK